MDRTRRARLLLVVPLLAAGIALGASTPAAAAQNCTTPVAGGTIKGGIVVPTGARCYLSGVAVRGGVTVAPGAFFQANSGTEIRGAVTATEPAEFSISESVVHGAVTVADGTNMAFLEVWSSEVRGDLVLTGNDTFDRWISLQGNTVRGSIVLRDNTVPETGGGFEVQGNAIGVDLDCSGNSPAPTATHIPNTVGGVATNQCAGLVAP